MTRWDRILVALDEGETSLRALRYVGRMTVSMTNISICLLHIYPEPPPDFYIKGGTLEDYQAEKETRGKVICDQGEKVLLESGIRPGMIRHDIRQAAGRTISQMVLEVQREGDFGTVVVGKRGVSKAEEFLFGSISNALARYSSQFTTWVVG